MVFIISKNDIILNVCDTIDNVYHNILSYTRIILYCDKNKIDFFNNLTIVEYNNNGCLCNSYKINTSTLDIYDENKNKVNINSKTLIRNKVELEVLLKKDAESEINLFIPVDVNSSDEISNSDANIYIKSNQNQNQNNHNDEIIKLREKIELEKLKLERDNIKYESNLNKYIDDIHEFKLIEREEKNKREKEEEEKRIFKSDKHTFNCMLNEINNKERDPDNIPEIFKNKFKILQQLKSETEYLHLSSSDEYDKYLEIKKKFNISNNIPTQYDGMFESNAIYQKLYNDLQDSDESEED
jgi:hypothetical protein